MSFEEGVLNWGILGTGGVCQDFLTALSYSAEMREKHTVTFVGASNVSKAEKFVQEYQGKLKAGTRFGSYVECLEDAETEIIYIGVIHPFHYDLAMKALNAGKHVLVEKPFAMNLCQATEIVNLARKKKLFCMEAMWSRFSPAYEKMSLLLRDDPALMVNACFSYGPASRGVLERITKTSLGGGCILDVGGYLIQFAQFIFGGERPERVITQGFKDPGEGIDKHSSIILKYSGGRMATLSLYLGVDMPRFNYVGTEKGFYNIGPRIMLPKKIEHFSSGKVWYFDEPHGVETNFPDSVGFRHEINSVYQCIKVDGVTENPGYSLNETLLVSEIMEEALTEITGRCRSS